MDTLSHGHIWILRMRSEPCITIRSVPWCLRSGLVFVSTIDTPLDPRNVLRVWQALLAAAGVPRRSFHVTRHTAVRLLIAEGIPLKIIREVLGHTLLSTTADIYGHLFPQALVEAADAMDRALG